MAEQAEPGGQEKAPTLTGRLPGISVIMYAYNEEYCIEKSGLAAIRDLSEITGHLVSRFELIIVDDGSTDRTSEITREIIRKHPEVICLQHERNKGVGAALKTGVAHSGLDLVTGIPADGQVTVREVARLLPSILKGHAMAVGYFERRREVDSGFRMFLSKGLRFYMRLALGTSQAMDGLFVCNKSLFSSLGPKSDSFMLNLELPVRAVKSGVDVDFRPIGVHARLGGTSKMLSLKKIAKVWWEVLVLGVDLRLNRPPLRSGAVR
ncbi:MAG: glycosyltransferase family 2 protein [Deltaproteobacteria bacterium]|nr:glycosyltransferase family 2 protein [Deltaproteobacteria bacterium]